MVCVAHLVNAQTSKKIKVLFIGNSYTYVNNLPQLIYNVALANGDTLVFDSSAPGGFTFGNHFLNSTTNTKISAGGWQYVVLQAQSQEPSFSPGQVNSQTLPYAIKLDSLIKHYNPCATTVFYETWGRKNGDASNCAFYPPICTYTGMQNRLKESYKLFADTCHAILSPVGEAYRSSITASPSINLYQADESHPSVEGSYLAAALFYEVLFQRSVTSNTYNPGLSPANHLFLQQTAHNTFRDSLSVWNFGKHQPWAAFNYSLQNGSNYQFQAAMNSLNHQWYFGDGAGSNLTNPGHTYTVAGTYTVSYVNYTACKRDSATAVITVTLPPVNALKDEVNTFKPDIYPNPFKDKLSIKLKPGAPDAFKTCRIYAIDGNLVYSGQAEGMHQLGELRPGLYFLSLYGDKASQQVKLIKAP